MKKKHKKYKAVLIGCGWVGMMSQLDLLRAKPASHAEVLAFNSRIIFAGMADNDAKNLKLAQKLYPGIPQFCDPKDMFREVAPDIVVIATHPDSHAMFIKLAAQMSVKAILCEKPISDNIMTARDAIKTAKKHNSFLFVDHYRRFDPLLRKYQGYVHDGYVRDTFLGKIKMATGYYGKGIFHSGTHMVDFMRFFLGEIDWVSAVRNAEISCSKGDFNADILLGFKSGATAVLQCFDYNDYVLSEVSFFGERGRLHIKRFLWLDIEVQGLRSAEDSSHYQELDYDRPLLKEGGKRSMFAPVIAHIVDCLDGRSAPVSTGEDELRTLAALFAIKKSVASQGKKVYIRN